MSSIAAVRRLHNSLIPHPQLNAPMGVMLAFIVALICMSIG